MVKHLPRVVVVTRATELDLLLARHATREQARFFLESRGQSLDPVAERHALFTAALRLVLSSVPSSWRSTRVDRGDLDRFLFAEDDIVVALGQDGLVANVAKYLSGQPVVGLDPFPGRNAGILVPHSPTDVGEILPAVAAGGARFEERTLVEARTDDGQVLRALNEVFVGHRSHQSARYRIRHGGDEEYQSSSGVIVTTGTGATGWARSIRRERNCRVTLPGPTDPVLAFFVREAWPSPATGTGLTDGLLEGDTELEIVSRMDDDGVVFGDGMESDRIEFSWGRRLALRTSDVRLRLFRG